MSRDVSLNNLVSRKCGRSGNWSRLKFSNVSISSVSDSMVLFTREHSIVKSSVVAQRQYSQLNNVLEFEYPILFSFILEFL